MDFVGRYPKETIIELFADHVNSGKASFFRQMGMDFVFGRREGIYVWDVDGKKRIINCHCNGGVFNLGHRNPAIIKTMTAAMKELDIGNDHLISEARAMLAKRLAELAPEKNLPAPVLPGRRGGGGFRHQARPGIHPKAKIISPGAATTATRGWRWPPAMRSTARPSGRYRRDSSRSPSTITTPLKGLDRLRDRGGHLRDHSGHPRACRSRRRTISTR